MFHWAKRHMGELMIGLGIAHSALALSRTSQLSGMLADGWLGSASNDDLRKGWLWFAAAGVSLINGGILIRELQQRGVRVPRAFGLIVVANMLLISSAIPKSGAPAGVLLGLLLLTGGEPRESTPVATKML